MEKMTTYRERSLVVRHDACEFQEAWLPSRADRGIEIFSRAGGIYMRLFLSSCRVRAGTLACQLEMCQNKLIMKGQTGNDGRGMLICLDIICRNCWVLEC